LSLGVVSNASESPREQQRLDVLILNAGVMHPPIDDLSAQGYDMQFGTNVLGMRVEAVNPSVFCHSFSLFRTFPLHQITLTSIAFYCDWNDVDGRAVANCLGFILHELLLQPACSI
jgi:NAD(P)-dependent dehydrogenase (short-subunit alcohol dehydrogenase family)